MAKRPQSTLDGYMRRIITTTLMISLISAQILSGQTAFAQTSSSEPQTFRLLLISTPSKADVFINGQKVGTTPYADHLRPGRYQVRVSKDRYAQWSRRVQLQSDQRIVLNLSRLPEPRKRNIAWTVLGILVTGGLAAGVYGLIRNRTSDSSSNTSPGNVDLPDNPPNPP